MSEPIERVVLRRLLMAAYEHIGTNGDTVVGKDGRATYTMSQLLADLSQIEVMKEAAALLELNAPHEQLIQEGKARARKRVIDQHGPDLARVLPEFKRDRAEGAGPLFDSEAT